MACAVMPCYRPDRMLPDDESPAASPGIADAAEPGTDPSDARNKSDVRHNWMGHSYIGHNYIGHNHIGHNYMGRNYMGHSYAGHN